MNRSIDTTLLVREIVNILWFIIVLYVVATSINLFFTTYEQLLFIKEVIFYPALLLVGVMSVLEICMVKRVKKMDYILIVGMTMMVCVIIIALYDKTVAIFLLVLPSLVSLYFYKMRLFRFASILGVISFLLIYFLSTNVRSHVNHSDFILIISIVLGVSLLINSLLKRSFLIFNELLKSTKENQHLMRRTKIDPVTELYNHRSFYEHLELVVQGEVDNIHVAVLDIDNFKRINDTFGHLAGDRVIVNVAKQIQAKISEEDFPSRYGGEEFAIISTGLSTEDFLHWMESIRQTIAATQFEELNNQNITVSIGIQKLQEGMDKEVLFKGADHALYRAKKSGKNKTVVNEQE